MPFLKPQKEPPKQWKKWNQRTNREGYRGAVFGSSNKQKYTGWYHKNVKSGKGFQSYEDANGFRTFYEGDWENDKRHGHGFLSFDCDATKKTLRIYSGSWKNDTMSGSGMKSFPDGGLYKGDFRNGMRHGIGIMYYHDGCIYTGEWNKDQRHGIGRLVNTKGDYYEGTFKKDTKCGLGRFYHLTTGQLQEGLWFDDLPQTTILFDDPIRRSVNKSTGPFRIFQIPPLTVLKNPRQVYLQRAYEVLDQVEAFAAGTHKVRSKI
ncbi:unnamed protein product [Orchesella dallaii]|uniref:MORN repeat-containing protein 3 n=1 Tax=Orchesella dallaii TaxID=48710 RepID=A0ABP1Q6A1_9HEXA